MKIHEPVMTKEVEKFLALSPGKMIIDATLGTGGHSAAILKKIEPKGKLIGIDQDKDALLLAKKRLSRKNVLLIYGNFRELPRILKTAKAKAVDGILFDLGISTRQIMDAERGFSFQKDGPLDMRMDQTAPIKASSILSNYSYQDLKNIFKKIGEEPYASPIAKNIVEERTRHPLVSTGQLVEIIKKSLPEREIRRRKKHFATNIFRALRMVTNSELEALDKGVSEAINFLKKDGRIVVISYHSLEDRIVKNIFKKEARGCLCPKDFPVCRCGQTPRLQILTKKPLVPSQNEINKNPKSRSAKLRAAKKIIF